MKPSSGWNWHHTFFAEVNLQGRPCPVGVRVVYRVAEACPGTAIERVGPVRVFELDGLHDRAGSVAPKDLRRLEQLADGDELERVRREVVAEVQREGRDVAVVEPPAPIGLEDMSRVLSVRLVLLRAARGRLGGRPVVASTVDLGAA